MLFRATAFFACMGLIVSSLSIWGAQTSWKQHTLPTSIVLMLTTILAIVIGITWWYHTIHKPLQRLRKYFRSAMLSDGAPERRECGVFSALAGDIHEFVQANHLQASQDAQRAFRQGILNEQRSLTQNLSDGLQPTLAIANTLEQALFEDPTKPLEEMIAHHEYGLASEMSLNIPKLKSVSIEIQTFIKQLRELSFALNKNVKRQQTLLKGLYHRNAPSPNTQEPSNIDNTQKNVSNG